MATLWNRTPKLNPLLKESKDYIFSEIIVAEELVNGVKILIGDYENVIFYYGHVKMVPVNDLFTLAYQYTVWDSAGHTKAELAESPAFKILLGDILVAIIADEKDKGEYVSLRKNEEED